MHPTYGAHRHTLEGHGKWVRKVAFSRNDQYLETDRGLLSINLMPGGHSDPKAYEEYTVAIICAINFEMSAVRYMLDREHPRLPANQGDTNMYVLGELSCHHIVVAYLPGNQGKGAAAIVTSNMDRTFTSHAYVLGFCKKGLRFRA
ncbi:hypothetical protein MMYC01_210583 [Madurella mycetomatis]|uniref:Uncharacterized protein n=1 Tax=Madurella mycetomatis TaxID=100816 RepID=A0A175VPG6_9PEZI|nr:hypothetical protein MMYC01_210583 [Madurella mycetomatis]